MLQNLTSSLYSHSNTRSMRNISTPVAAHKNGIFNSLPAKEYEYLLPHLEEASLPTCKNLHDYGDEIDYVYFPINAVIYLFLTMENGATVEAGMIGSEGVLGASVFMGVKTTSSQAIVLSPNKALRIKTEIIKREFDKGGALHDLILRYIHAFCLQISQTAACNRIHHREGKLCRWLLMMQDRVKSNKLAVTQEFISYMLGMRRPYITAAVGLLQKEGIISCTRGSIEIIDRLGLEKHSCECYAIIQDEFSQLNKKAA